MGILDDFREYFYEYPGNPVELSNTEEKVKKVVPKKERVVEDGEEGIATKEVQNRAREKGVKKDTARKKLYALKRKGVLEKITSNKWVRTGRYKKLSEKKLKNLFVLLGFSSLVVGMYFNSPWPLLFTAIFLIISVTVFW